MTRRPGRRQTILQNFDGSTLASGAYLLGVRVSEIPAPYWAFGITVGWVEFLISDGFFWLWVVLAIANAFDWLAGRWAVRATEPENFSRKKSRLGIYSKALGLVVIGLLRAMEEILPLVLATPGTGGYVASVIGLALFVDELDSIDFHRQRLGKRPIPMLSWGISRLRKLTGAERRGTPREGIPEADPVDDPSDNSEKG